MDTFGMRIKKLRNEKEMRGEELGKVLNVTKVAVSKWENDQRFPDKDTLINMAKFFNVSTDYLLGISDIRLNFTEPTSEDLNKYEHLLTDKEKQEVESMANEVFNNFEFNAYKIETLMDPETNDKVKAAILDLCKEIKIKNKIKYNPNKNKNK